MLLANYAACKTKDFVEAQRWIEANTSGSTFSILEYAGVFSYRANACKLKDVSMLWSWCAAPNRISYPPQDYVRKVFQIAGNGSFTVGGNPKSHEAAGACLFVPAEVALIQENGADGEQLVLGVSSEALKAKMAVLLGADVDHFELLRPSAAEIVLLRQAIFSFAYELNQFGPLLSCIALAEMEQMIIFRFLLLHRNSHTKLLMKPSYDVSERTVRVVDEYISTNWHKPIDFEELSRLTGVSIRSIYRTFKKRLGITPLEKLKQVRLENARSMLLAGNSRRSVMQVGLKCGFQSLGHFSRDYREAYGELPSATLRRSLRGI